MKMGDYEPGYGDLKERIKQYSARIAELDAEVERLEAEIAEKDKALERLNASASKPATVNNYYLSTYSNPVNPDKIRKDAAILRALIGIPEDEEAGSKELDNGR